ncbi:MAG: hypothetical protein Q7K55_02580 [Candidatus Levybacteria bacterium]|nr:hypothetical protein [Candidatus Levybacteria bacterium]
MGFIIFLISFFVGLMVASFTLLQVFIILFFGIPTAKSVEKLGYLKENNNIVRNYCVSLIIISSIYFGIYLLVHNFFPNTVTGFLAGTVATFVFGLGKVGRNKANISDFVETNKDRFTEHPGKVIEAILTRK